MTDLSKRKCVPCRGGVPALAEPEARALLRHLDGWRLEDGHLLKGYRFRNFVDALEFVNAVGEVAEKNGHHPDVHLAWGRVGLEIWTHAIDGLTESDFVLAAKCDKRHAKLAASQAKAAKKEAKAERKKAAKAEAKEAAKAEKKQATPGKKQAKAEKKQAKAEKKRAKAEKKAAKAEKKQAKAEKKRAKTKREQAKAED